MTVPFGAGDPADDLTPVLVHPKSGEVVDLKALDTDPLIGLAEAVSDVLARARDAKRQVEDELELRRRAQGGSAKALTGDRLSASRSVSRKWDTNATIQALQRLVESGAVPVDEANALVPEVTVRKPDGRGLGSLLTRLTDAGDLESAQLLLSARSEYARWEIAHSPALAQINQTEETR